MAKKSNLQPWEAGDIFLVDTGDGLCAVGQVLAYEKAAMDSAACAFFELRVKGDDELQTLRAMPQEKLFSVLLATRDALDNGSWRVVKRLPVKVPRSSIPFEHLRKSGWVGAKIIGSGNIDEFLKAFYGLVPWDGKYDPAYFDKLLIAPTKRPSGLIFKKSGD